MGTLSDYLDWRGDLRFFEVGLCEVDSLILSMISYLDFGGIVPTAEEGGSITFLETMRKYLKLCNGKPSTLGRFVPPETVAVAVKAAKTRRFAGIRLSHYICETDDEEPKQFAALTFRITRDKYFVTYRGTDDTLTGWKEDFNMSFMLPVPAQLSAAEYFARVSEDINGKFYLGGHSKGGNLAVYAAVKAPERAKEHILGVFSNDGPGFDKNFISGRDYAEMKDRIRTIVPQSSVVGMLLEHEENYEVIKSNATGLLQHHGHTWEVMGGSFLHLDTVTEDSRLIDEKLKAWLDEMTPEEREQFVDTVFETLSSTNAKTLTELSSEKVKLVKAWSSLEPKTRNVILKCISILIKHNAITIVKK
ncbi:MAG: DUF2974 domain-containing protein [Clostridia bacterium]|nr:DUF2974 domain-containing protein [Clostridia bacterium]